MKKANIDGDIICYSIAYAAKDEPIEYVLSTVKRFLTNTTDRAGCGEYQVYLTGSNNFRKEIAVTKPYKGNRKQEKPEYWEDIRNYLLVEKDAILCDEVEADDALGINQTEDTVLCTIDKDLRMIAGWHYNWNKEHLYEVSQEEADAFFMAQWLAGDSTDNIAGCKGIGLIKAEKAFAEVGAETVEEKLEVVNELYASKGHSPEYQEEMGHLIWMQRKDALTYKEWLDAQ